MYHVDQFNRAITPFTMPEPKEPPIPPGIVERRKSQLGDWLETRIKNDIVLQNGFAGMENGNGVHQSEAHSETNEANKQENGTGVEQTGNCLDERRNARHRSRSRDFDTESEEEPVNGNGHGIVCIRSQTDRVSRSHNDLLRSSNSVSPHRPQPAANFPMITVKIVEPIDPPVDYPLGEGNNRDYHSHTLPTTAVIIRARPPKDPFLQSTALVTDAQPTKRGRVCVPVRRATSDSPCRQVARWTTANGEPLTAGHRPHYATVVHFDPRQTDHSQNGHRRDGKQRARDEERKIIEQQRKELRGTQNDIKRLSLDLARLEGERYELEGAIVPYHVSGNGNGYANDRSQALKVRTMEPRPKHRGRHNAAYSVNTLPSAHRSRSEATGVMYYVTDDGKLRKTFETQSMGVDLNFPIPNGSGATQDTDTTDRDSYGRRSSSGSGGSSSVNSQIVSFQDQVIMYTSNGSTGKEMLIQKLERELTDAQQCNHRLNAQIRSLSSGESSVVKRELHNAKVSLFKVNNR
ncbi:hypothetical protein WR25_09401 [Diploscapter pachys]|uniref:Uncharacterized protein n=1 Tax=Diploscapter pachys TaxID=2018661 RepID=A0A2A2JU48_9BILA|nr:hypothetical protein WR25_09401 [Diploscapter pachys]